MCVDKPNFNQDWYGMQAKVLSQSDDCVVVDYGCNGRGIVKNYNLFEGIQLCFLDFETDGAMKAQKFNPDIIQITHCQTGRYECEFANHTVSYLPEGYFSVAATEHLPVSFSFPLRKYYGVSLVIDRQALSDATRRIMQTIPIDLDKIYMSEQAKAVGVSDKMKAKDYITLGIFTVLFFAVVMVCIFASAATVVTFAFGSAIAAIPGGIIYMLMRAKVPKAGSVLLSGVVIGLIEFLIGAGWAVAVGFIAGAVIAELLARIGHYKSFWLNTIGYSVYMMFFALGTYLPMVIMTGYVDDMSTSNGVSAEYLTELHSFMNGTMVVIIAVVTFVAGIVGALIAKGVFKKHFQKAGIV